MYDYIKGTLEKIVGNVAIVENQGIGYQIHCSLTDIGALSLEKGKEVKIYLYLIHKEDAMTLYGFLTEESREGYQLLLKVGGIGPRTALNMLSRYDIGTIAQSIEQEDIPILKKIPGIGEKTAKKIVLDLKGKFSGIATAALSDPEKDIVAAMVAMGYNENDVLKCCDRVKPFSGNFSTDIKKLLKMMI